MSQSTIYAFVGTYTGTGSQGIYAFRMDAGSGRLALLGTTGGLPNPSFLAVHPSKRYLYAVNEVDEFGGKHGGAVSAFAIEANTGRLTPINQQSSVGAGPCHIIVDATGKWALVSNYGDGSVAVLPVGGDGALGPASDFVQHRGSSVNRERQAGPHAHSTTLDAGNRIAVVADLGLDKLMLYRFDAGQGKLRPGNPAAVSVKPGAGPRHFTFHPSGKYAYVINELDNTVTAFAYDAARGALRELQTLSTLPPGYAQVSYCADIHVAPTGRFVYGSNRGHDSLVVFKVDEGSGKLSAAGHTATRGRWPRNFALDPTHRFLLVANQESDTLVTFELNAQTGQLAPTGQTISIPRPVCVKFAVM